jgi:enoyl-CoA hydratase/carnithine racemase
MAPPWPAASVYCAPAIWRLRPTARSSARRLLNYVAPADELDAKLDWLLARIVDKSPTAVRLGKHGFHAMQDMVLDQAFAFAQLMLPAMARTEDAREGFAAFAQKRPPVWTGK